MCLRCFRSLYSPVCDVDTVAYKEFLDVCRRCVAGAVEGGADGRYLLGIGSGDHGCAGDELEKPRWREILGVEGVGRVGSQESIYVGGGGGSDVDAVGGEGEILDVKGAVLSGSGGNKLFDGVKEVGGVVRGGVADGGGFGDSVKVVPLVVEKEKKKKRGKNQRDREKYVQAIKAASWRKDEGRKDEKSDLRVSLEKKWAAQNELAAEKARKDLEYQKARDVDAEARKSRARLMKETESSKVATEKAFAFLKSTGNVAGFCETVVSDSSSPGLTDGSSPSGSVPGCTISPDSSASMHEFREAQKKIADQEFQIKKLTRQLALGKLSAGEEAAFTIHSDGEVSDDVKEAIAKCKNDFFDVDTNDDGFEDEKPRTLFAKRVAIPGADEYLYDNY